MKKISLLWVALISFVLTGIPASSQKVFKLSTSFIEPYPLAVAFYKTTNLVFPYAIKSVDRGSKDLLAQKAKGVDNILQVKAGKPNFEETNLTVITADGKLYSYLVRYANNPYPLNIEFSRTDTINEDSFFSQAIGNEAILKATTEKLTGAKRSLYRIRDRKYGIKLILNGLYIVNDVLYYQLKIENNSNISYDIDQIRFIVNDQNKSKRTASQEVEIYPVYAGGNPTSVTRQSEQVMVFALPKFTLPNQKYLAIELIEKNGGRNLKIKVHNHIIERARTL